MSQPRKRDGLSGGRRKRRLRQSLTQGAVSRVVGVRVFHQLRSVRKTELVLWKQGREWISFTKIYIFVFESR